MTSGVFFHRRAAGAWPTAAVHPHVVGQQRLSPLGDGVRIQAGGCGDGAVASPPEPEGLQPREEPPLLLIQQTHEQDHGGLGFVGLGVGLAPQRERGCLGGRVLARAHLLAPSAAIRRAVEVPPRHVLPDESTGSRQAEEGLFHLDAQLGRELGGEIAARGARDQGLEGVDERADARKAHAPVGPQAALVKLGGLLERVVLAPVRVAGEVGQLAQFAEDGHVDRGAQRGLQLVHRRDRAALQQAGEGRGEKGFSAHNVRHTPNEGEV